tara:strand:- start:839 stop:1012 length:174 start_codon:yes stop_codon:yes gene_type:complete
MKEKRHILADDYEFIIPKKGLNLIQSLYEFEYMRLSSSGREALDELADLINKANNFK